MVNSARYDEGTSARKNIIFKRYRLYKGFRTFINEQKLLGRTTLEEIMTFLDLEIPRLKEEHNELKMGYISIQRAEYKKVN